METRLEVPDSRNPQRFHEQWNLVDSPPDSRNVPRSVDPYASDYTFAQYRTQAVKSLLPSSFTKSSGRKQEVDEFYDRGDRGR